MGREGSRVAAIVFLAAAAVLVGVGRATGQNWLVGLAFGLFALGAGTFMRWRSAQDARVLAPEEKTSADREEQPREDGQQ